jgi:PST family polysaccharide transporter
MVRAQRRLRARTRGGLTVPRDRDAAVSGPDSASVIAPARGFAPAFWALADQCVVSAANFVTVFVFARSMATTAFGEFTIAQTVLLLLTGLQGALLAQPHNVLGPARSEQSYRRFTAALLLAQLVGGVLACGTIAAAGALMLSGPAPHAGGITIALACAALPWMAQELVRRVLFTRGESKSVFLNDVLTYGLQVAGAVAVVDYFGDASPPESALAALGLSSLVGALAGTFQIRHHFSLRELDRPALREALAEVWQFGKWLGGQNVLAWVGAQGQSWIVAVLLGAEQVGVLRVATHLVNLLNPIRQAVFSYLPSRGSYAYHHGGAPALSRWVRSKFWLLSLGLLPLCAVLVAFPEPLLALVYGERYATAEAALILSLCAAGQLLTFIKFPYDVGILALGAPRSIFYLSVVPVVLLVTLGVALVYWLGLMGVPVFGILVNAVLLAATIVVYLRLLHGGGSGARERAGSLTA